MMNLFKSDEIVVLLGAGASVDAGIPHSAEMIKKLEERIDTDSEWKQFRDLYHYIRSSIYYSDGIHGRNKPQEVNYNIERLVDTLNQISMKNEHTLYPFVGAWNPTLVEVAGYGFSSVEELKKKIVNELMTYWLSVEDYGRSAAYYSGLIEFQREYEFPLRIFTLNYDLCLEKVCELGGQIHLERGFNDQRQWDWRQFDYDDGNEAANLYLYKLHGSKDWIWRDDILTFTDDGSHSDAAIIFGTSYKLEYRDPFLFCAYEFRKWTLVSRLLLVIGYGFGDAHINKIIQQALSNDPKRRLLAVTPLREEDEQQKSKSIADALDLKTYKQITVCNMNAKEFMENQFSLGYLTTLVQDESGDSIPI